MTARWKAHGKNKLEGSLQALGVDAIDAYQFHSGTDEAFRNEELWNFLREQSQAGRCVTWASLIEVPAANCKPARHDPWGGNAAGGL
jgi:aryl-alcohol dehydrogenase-like predicted oxidoreductase